VKAFALIVALALLPACSLKKPLPAKPATVATPSTIEVDAKVAKAIADLVDQAGSLETIEEKIALAIKISEEIELLTRTEDAQFVE
jgi:predicted small lipoprotein YifL